MSNCGVPWDDYVRLRELPENRHVRMTYDQGILDLAAPSRLHERIAELLARLVSAWTEHHAVPMQSCGTTSFQRKDLARGLEPDKCYYIQHEPRVRGPRELDLSIDPPPDLVIEVDVASPSRDRLNVYAALGVPEVWVWRNERLRVLLLDAGGGYRDTSQSQSLGGFPSTRPARSWLIAIGRMKPRSSAASGLP